MAKGLFVPSECLRSTARAGKHLQHAPCPIAVWPRPPGAAASPWWDPAKDPQGCSVVQQRGLGAMGPRGPRACLAFLPSLCSLSLPCRATGIPPRQPGTPSEGVRCGADLGSGTGARGAVLSPAGTSTRAWGVGSPVLPGPGPMGACSSGWFGQAELWSSHKASGRAKCQASALLASPGTRQWGNSLLAFPFCAPGIPLCPWVP